MTIRNRRLATVVAAPVAALIAWACIRLGGIDLVVTTGDGSVGPADVVVAALAAALAGWFVVRLLERYTDRPGF
jgi:molybdopterin biosynthesis enzyme